MMTIALIALMVSGFFLMVSSFLLDKKMRDWRKDTEERMTDLCIGLKTDLYIERVNVQILQDEIASLKKKLQNKQE